jgi:MerR family transcriptional regulator, copper efflux regulator
MNIQSAAKAAGLSPQTLRYYEQIDLVRPSGRADNGYRIYTGAEVEQLRFIQRARNTGFNIDECRDLLALHSDSSRQSKHVKGMVLEKAEQVARQIEALQHMHAELLRLADTCRGDDHPHCAILDQISEGSCHE